MTQEIKVHFGPLILTDPDVFPTRSTIIPVLDEKRGWSCIGCDWIKLDQNYVETTVCMPQGSITTVSCRNLRLGAEILDTRLQIDETDPCTLRYILSEAGSSVPNQLTARLNDLPSDLVYVPGPFRRFSQSSVETPVGNKPKEEWIRFLSTLKVRLFKVDTHFY